MEISRSQHPAIDVLAPAEARNVLPVQQPVPAREETPNRARDPNPFVDQVQRQEALRNLDAQIRERDEQATLVEDRLSGRARQALNAYSATAATADNGERDYISQVLGVDVYA